MLNAFEIKNAFIATYGRITRAASITALATIALFAFTIISLAVLLIALTIDAR